MTQALKKTDLSVSSYDVLAAEYYDAAKHPTCRNFREASALVVEAFLLDHSLTGVSICEVGAGDSIVADILSNRDPGLVDLYLLDSSLSMLLHSLQYRQRGAKLIIGDAEKLPFRSGSFELVIASLGDPYNTPAFWSQISNVLRSDGWCLFTTPSFDWASRYRNSAESEMPDLALFDLSNGERLYVPSLINPIHEQCAIIRSYGLSVHNVQQVSAQGLRSPISPKIALGSSVEIPSIVTGYVIQKEQGVANLSA